MSAVTLRNRAQQIVKESCERVACNFNELSANTSIHGLKFITEQGAHWSYRLLWNSVCIGAFIFSSYFCHQMWDKWDKSPAIISIDTYHYPLKNINFPAVTVCSVNKASKQDIMTILANETYSNNLNYEEIIRALRIMTRIDRAFDFDDQELEELEKLLTKDGITTDKLYSLLIDASISCNEMIIDCTWFGITCTAMNLSFTLLPTDDGLCCTFNGPNYSDPYLGIDSSIREKLFSVSGNGPQRGLSIVLNGNLSDYTITNGNFNGFKVLVHSSDEFPDVADRGLVIGPGNEAFLSVTGVTTFNTEDVVKKVPIEKRNCIVEGERKLDYYSNYSRSACIVECTTKKMLEDCECRPYFFRAGNNNLCNITSYGCISKVYGGVRYNETDFCPQCLPSCNEVWYFSEISYAPFPGEGFKLSRSFQRLNTHHLLDFGNDTLQYLA